MDHGLWTNAMSHGGRLTNAEPNLVPLLDLVLQLVMFFMMCANFVMEQVDQTILLPVAQQAKPMAETGPDVVFLNVTADGALLVTGRSKPLTTDAEVQVFLQTVHDDALARAQAEAKRAKREPPTEAPTLVIVRAHRDVSFAQVYKVLSRCQAAGLRKLQLRAVRAGG
jgi:biopolymer transport protein ExbD